jgi:hypothetical protein
MYKHYLVALGVNEDLEVALSTWRVELSNLEAWMKKTPMRQDEIAQPVLFYCHSLFMINSADYPSYATHHPLLPLSHLSHRRAH